jgi:hypothetical protein
VPVAKAKTLSKNYLAALVDVPNVMGERKDIREYVILRLASGEAIARCEPSPTSASRPRVRSDAQQHAVEVYAAAQSIGIVAVVDRAVGGRSPVEDRPVLLDASSMLRDQDADLLFVRATRPHRSRFHGARGGAGRGMAT